MTAKEYLERMLTMIENMAPVGGVEPSQDEVKQLAEAKQLARRGLQRALFDLEYAEKREWLAQGRTSEPDAH